MAREHRGPDFLLELRDTTVDESPAGLLGSGALGQVRKGTYQGTVVAFKQLFYLRTDAESIANLGGALSPAERQGVLRKFMQECTFMHTLTHPNIVPFFGVVVDDTPERAPLYLAMQYIPTGTLHDLVHSPRYQRLRVANGGCLPFETQIIALTGLFSALEYLAQRHFIHRDVKPCNILAMVQEAEGLLTKVLLADFGEAKQLTQTHVSRVSGAGTPVYQAPEMRSEEDAKTPKADVFSAGVVMAEVSSGRSPNPGPEFTGSGRRRQIVFEEERRQGDIEAVRDPEIRRLVQRCIVEEPEERADASEIAESCRLLLRSTRAVSRSPLPLSAPSPSPPGESC
jgi:serine/threonine protein kinase